MGCEICIRMQSAFIRCRAVGVDCTVLGMACVLCGRCDAREGVCRWYWSPGPEVTAHRPDSA